MLFLRFRTQLLECSLLAVNSEGLRDPGQAKSPSTFSYTQKRSLQASSLSSYCYLTV